MEYTLNFDGSCWPNPAGKAGYGFVIKKDNEIIQSGSGYIGEGDHLSNNYAEFMGLAVGLEAFSLLNGVEGASLKVIGDSQLIINLMTNVYKPKSSMLYYPAYILAANVDFKLRQDKSVKITYKWVRREQNTLADELSTEYRRN